MQLTNEPAILVEQQELFSEYLQRIVQFDCYLPTGVDDPAQMSLLLINDGQNMEEMGFLDILEQLYASKSIDPVFCVAIHAGEQRKMEYGVAGQPDYLGRGAMAGAYSNFILDELLPWIREKYNMASFREKAFAGFSLGALSALDIVWSNPAGFSKVGVFSGSLWWRSIDQSAAHYDDHLHRIMHQQIRTGEYHPWLRFFLQCGNKDETKDRNNNGIIDSIDDTLDLITELVKKGYDRQQDIHYLEMADGSHDVPTWGRAMPEFLVWGWGR